MKEMNLTPNRITFNTIMDGSVKMGKMREALLLFEQMSEYKIEADNFTYSILLNGLKLNDTNP